MKIGIDIDGVTADFVTPFLPVLRHILGRDVCYEDITTYRFQDAFEYGEEVESHTQAEIDRLDILRHLPLIPGVLETINRFSEAHEVHFVTARPGDHWGSGTRDWLGACGFVYRSVMYREGREAEVADGFSVFVEDKLETALELVDVGIHVFLFDRPWNQTEGLPENCVRVGTWQEIEGQMPDFESI